MRFSNMDLTIDHLLQRKIVRLMAPAVERPLRLGCESHHRFEESVPRCVRDLARLLPSVGSKAHRQPL